MSSQTQDQKTVQFLIKIGSVLHLHNCFAKCARNGGLGRSGPCCCVPYYSCRVCQALLNPFVDFISDWLEIRVNRMYRSTAP